MGFDPNELETWFSLQELYLWLSEWEDARALAYSFDLDPQAGLISVRQGGRAHGTVSVRANTFVYVHFNDALGSFVALTLGEAFNRLETVLCPSALEAMSA